MNKRVLLAGLLLVPVAGFAAVAWQFRGAAPAVLPPPDDLPTLISKNETGLPLTLPAGLSVSVLAKNLPGARVLAQHPSGDLYVSQPSQGQVSVIAPSGETRVLLKGLDKPHGLAFDPQDSDQLYVATETKIYRYNVSPVANAVLVKVLDLPKGGRHFTRTIKFGPDNRLYVSIGSTCDVCDEQDERYAALWSLKKDGTDFKQVAKGLRNTVFFAWDDLFGELWGTDMGRDGLGDALPPDEVNVIKQGGNYGWPVCYGQNVHDTAFDKKTYIRNPCMEPFETPAKVDLPAHVAPLGIAFVPEEGWPEDWWYDAVVAEHGSWNSSTPVGYKLVRVKRNAKGNVEGVEDFVTGFLKDGRVLGRPVDVLIRPGGTMYVSDDKAGAVYRFQYGLR